MNIYRQAFCALFISVAAVAMDARGADKPRDEMRALFVTTANNIDWPSDKEQREVAQRDEMDTIIWRAQRLQCNTIILQVRAYGDRIWDGPNPGKEPWAASLNAVNPGYDPLGRWILRCHDAGIQLHAWVNPYRTDWPIIVGTEALRFFPTPDGHHLYLDPTSQKVEDYLIDEVIVRLLNYKADPHTARSKDDGRTKGPDDDDGVDGIVLDHYIPDPNGGVLRETKEKREEPTARIKKLMDDYHMGYPNPTNDQGVGFESFVKRVREKTKSKAVFGISPLVDELHPAGEQLDQTAKWLNDGICDYCIPELYLGPTKFKTTLDEWLPKVNAAKQKRVAVAFFTSRTLKPEKKGQPVWKASEIQEEMKYTRDKNLGLGHAHFSMIAMQRRRDGGPESANNVGDLAQKDLYSDVSAVPDEISPAGAAKPDFKAEKTDDWTVAVTALGGAKFRAWIYRVQENENGAWGPWLKTTSDQLKIPDGRGFAMQIIGVTRQNRHSDPKPVDISK